MSTPPAGTGSVVDDGEDLTAEEREHYCYSKQTAWPLRRWNMWRVLSFWIMPYMLAEWGRRVGRLTLPEQVQAWPSCYRQRNGPSLAQPYKKPIRWSKRHGQTRRDLCRCLQCRGDALIHLEMLNLHALPIPGHGDLPDADRFIRDLHESRYCQLDVGLFKAFRRGIGPKRLGEFCPGQNNNSNQDSGHRGIDMNDQNPLKPISCSLRIHIQYDAVKKKNRQVMTEILTAKSFLVPAISSKIISNTGQKKNRSVRVMKLNRPILPSFLNGLEIMDSAKLPKGVKPDLLFLFIIHLDIWLVEWGVFNSRHER